jgi:hypothetical protein
MNFWILFINLFILKIIKVDQVKAEHADKDLIIDNVYTTQQRSNIELKCPIELNKQPNKEESSRPKNVVVTASSSEFYDYADEENEDIKQTNIKRNADGSNLFIVQWYKGAVRINQQDRFKQDGVYLRIENVDFNDSGKYKCKLINGFGSVTTTLTLKVLPSTTTTMTPQSSTQILSTTIAESLPHLLGQEDEEETLEKIDLIKNKNSDLVRLPAFTNPERMQPRYFKKKIGSQVRFKCRASGVPRPDVLWFKNGEILNEEDFGITR